MTKQIHDYNAAISIDASADYFLVDPGGTGIYKRINRNTTLGISSAPLGQTDSQTVSNKTYNNTNAFTIKDGSLTLQNSADTTKQAVFSLSSITTGTTRTYTLPNASTTLVGTDNTATLTNKTITAPAISGGTIDNAAITVDSISGHSVSTTVTVANLQIANGVINTANAVTSTAVADGAIFPKALMAGTGSGWAWQTWSPTFTNLSGGSLGYAKYVQIGKTVFFKLSYTMAGANVSGGVSFTPPVTAVTASNVVVSQTVQFVQSGTRLFGILLATTTTSFSLFANTVNGTYAAITTLSSTVPFTWGNSDVLECSGSYEAA